MCFIRLTYHLLDVVYSLDLLDLLNSFDSLNLLNSFNLLTPLIFFQLCLKGKINFVLTSQTIVFGKVQIHLSEHFTCLSENESWKSLY